MKTAYGKLKAGDVFEERDWAYIKTTEPNTAVELNTGAMVHFYNSSQVNESDLILVHKADLPSTPPEFLNGGRDHA